MKSSDVAIINLSDCDCACGPLIGSSMIVQITYFIRLIYRLTFSSRNIPNPSIWLQLGSCFVSLEIDPRTFRWCCDVVYYKSEQAFNERENGILDNILNYCISLFSLSFEKTLLIRHLLWIEFWTLFLFLNLGFRNRLPLTRYKSRPCYNNSSRV